MHLCFSMRAMLAAGVWASATVVGITSPVNLRRSADAAYEATSVDVELVIAVDISHSMEQDELALQREGYAQALVSREFLQALSNGPHGKVAVTYFEWSAIGDQKLILPWRVIEGPESADAVASEIINAPIRRGSRTSISGAISFAMPLFAENPYRGLRRVLDVSGDGPNNNGPPVTDARDEAIGKGITINGLPIMMKEPSYPFSTVSKNLDLYYRDCVTGGPGSFVMTIRERKEVKEAIRTKLVLEVASLAPERKTVLATENRASVNCMIGDNVFRDRWGR